MAAIDIKVRSVLNSAVYDEYTIDDDDTVSDLKDLIQSNTSINPAWYQLVFNDVVLIDTETLASYDITDDSTLLSGNTIGRLPTLEDRQIAKLDLATLNRISVSDPYSEYDIDLLPSKYNGNTAVPNSHPDGLVLGRPWFMPT